MELGSKKIIQLLLYCMWNAYVSGHVSAMETMAHWKRGFAAIEMLVVQELREITRG